MTERKTESELVSRRLGDTITVIGHQEVPDRVDLSPSQTPGWRHLRLHLSWSCEWWLTALALRKLWEKNIAKQKVHLISPCTSTFWWPIWFSLSHQMPISLSHGTTSKESSAPDSVLAECICTIPCLFGIELSQIEELNSINLHFLTSLSLSTRPLQRSVSDSAECVCRKAKWVNFHSHGQTARWDGFLPNIQSPKNAMRKH